MTVPITVSLHRGNAWISKLIRWQTRSVYSHAGVVLPDGKFIESREGKGVLEHDQLVVANNEEVDLFHVMVSDDQALLLSRFLRSQLGKPYDWTMVARFITREQETRSSTGKWFCSELVFAAFLEANVELLRDTHPWEVSPGLLARSPLLKLKLRNALS